MMFRLCANTPSCQVVSVARRQVCGAVAHAPGDAPGQQAGQGTVDSRKRLAQDARQLHRIYERHSAEGVQHLAVGEGHVSSVTKDGRGVQPSHGSTGEWESVPSGFGNYTATRLQSLGRGFVWFRVPCLLVLLGLRIFDTAMPQRTNATGP